MGPLQSLLEVSYLSRSSVRLFALEEGLETTRTFRISSSTTEDCTTHAMTLARGFGVQAQARLVFFRFD